MYIYADVCMYMYMYTCILLHGQIKGKSWDTNLLYTYKEGYLQRGIATMWGKRSLF